MREFNVKNDLLDDHYGDFTPQIIDTINTNSNLSKTKIAKIIFSYKYEMYTKEEIEDQAVEYYKIDNNIKEE